MHFIGAVKPWHQPYNTSSGTVTPLPGSGHSQEFLQVWWNIFMSMVQPTLDPSLVGHMTRSQCYVIPCIFVNVGTFEEQLT